VCEVGLEVLELLDLLWGLEFSVDGFSREVAIETPSYLIWGREYDVIFWLWKRGRWRGGSGEGAEDGIGEVF